MNVFTLQPDEINENWFWIGPFLDRVEGGDWTPLEVRSALINQRAQLWGAREGSRVRGIWITKLEEGGKRGLVWIASGSPLVDGIALFNAHTEPWFRQKGCESVRVIGRRGWKRALPGYRELTTTFEKRL